MEKKEKYLSHYRIVISLMIFWLLHYLFFNKPTIGGNGNYVIYIFFLPMIVGLIIIGLYQRKFIIKELTIKEDWISKLINLTLNLIVGFFVSYLSFGSIAHYIWNQINIRESNNNIMEYYECEIESFHIPKGTSSRNKIWFYFKGRMESINVSYKSINRYENKNPKDFKLILNVKEGIWDNYIIDSYKIKTFANTGYK